MFRPVVALVFFLSLFGFEHLSVAGEFILFGPQNVERGTGKPPPCNFQFESPVTGSGFTLRVENGDAQGAGRVSSVHVYLNGNRVAGPSEINQQVGTIERTVSLEASNTLSLTLHSAPGSHLALTLTGMDNTPPVVEISTPANGAITDLGHIAVSGTVTDETPVTLTVNGHPVAIAGNTFDCTVPLAFGENTITASATDLGGNHARHSVSISRKDIAPPELVVAEPIDGFTTGAESIAITGTVKDASPVTVEVNGFAAAVSGEEFSVTDLPLAVGSNPLTVIASDSWGNSVSVTVTVTRNALNPPVEPQPQGSFGAQYEDLIPANATKSAYDPKRFALVTGEVKDSQDEPIAGVTVSVNAKSCVQCHGLEYGSVATDTSGKFTIAVEGGSTMTVVYQKPGLITSHRQVYVPWNGYAVADTIRMISEDTASTTFTFDRDPHTVVTHRSTQITDEFGKRAATMVFSGDNQAYEVDAKGSVIRELSTITTRATEFATPESMPAHLPPNVAYTYCAELSVDGAERVRFAKPVTLWVDNFLGFEVGGIVPLGYYDRDRGIWVPSENGVVVRLLDTTGDGIVDALGASGDNLPDDLNGNGDLHDEVNGLGDPGQYPPGATFWRATVDHFTPWDCNWPYGPPPDATPPNPAGEPNADQQLEEMKDCESQVNSFIEDRSRIFHEDIPIHGTDITLHYASNRVKGYKTRITVPASGSTVPPSLKRIVVRVEVAGRVLEKHLPPLSNQKAEFIWDGLDGMGRPVAGLVKAIIDTGFIYNAVYYEPGDFTQAFGNAGSQVTGIRARNETTSWRRTETDIPAIEEGLLAEGWTLSSQHYLANQITGTLLKGNGEKIGMTREGIISTVAGNGWPGSCGDGSPAVQGALSGSQGIAVDAAGNLYIADTNNHKIRKVDAAGIITTIAGNGSSGYGGDGGPAINAKLYYPQRVAIDTAGNLYIADSYNRRVRKVDVAGIITTIAGDGSTGYGGDGGPAIQASLSELSDVEVDAAGNVYIADYGYDRIRKVNVDGIITTVAGGGRRGGGLATDDSLLWPMGITLDATGNLYIAEFLQVRKVDPAGIITTVAGTGGFGSGYNGDGGPAVQAEISPIDVAVDAVGNLYIADLDGFRVWKVDAAGIITSIAGNGIDGYVGDGALAVQSELSYPWGVAVDSAGNLYIMDTGNSRVRKVARSHSFVNYGDNVFFPDKNGKGYILSNNGIHQKTIDLETGSTLRTFGYDIDDNLVTITDQFGNITTLDRSPDGVPASIVSPDGLKTQFTIDNNNHLTAVTYPDGSSYGFEYSPDGLMTAEVDPNGNRFEHVFDNIGRLADVTDPELGLWKYTRTEEASGDIQVQKTTGEGNITTYLDRTFSTGGYTSTITGPNGGISTISRPADGLTEIAALSCGMEVTSKYDLDPEYKVKFVKERAETTPAGKRKLTLLAKAYQDLTGDKSPDLITETVTVNGSTATLLHDVLQARREVISPAGRKVVSYYTPATLLAERYSVAGLHDIAYGYDAKGRLISLTQGARQTFFAYSSHGFLESFTDSESRTTIYGHDTLGRVTSIRRPDGSMVGFTYDNNGNMTMLVNSSAIPHVFDYNGVDYKTDYQTPLSGRYKYVYDRDRRLVETVFPSGRRILNAYEKDRIASILTPEGKVSFDYLCATKLGAVSKGGESIGYTYDGNFLTFETLSGTLGQILSYVYNNDFAVTSFAYADGTTDYAYDSDGLLTGADEFIISRNIANGLSESVSGGSFSLVRGYNGYGEVIEEAISVSGSARYAHSLTRSPAGRIVAKMENLAGETINYAYSYDDLGRLTTVSKNGTLVEEYRYNTNGARDYEMNALRGIPGRTLASSDEDHLLTAGDTTYQYDVDGFLASRLDAAGSTAYTYSSRGELLRIVQPDGGVIEFVHDPLGRRIAKKVDGVVVEKYLWQGMTRLLAVYDGSNSLLMRFKYADARMPVAMTKGGITYYFGYDQVESLRVVTGTTGNLVKRIEYDSFGNILADSNQAFAVPFGFAGGLHDRDIHLVRFGYRDYAPEIGRWTAKDPIGFDGGDVDLFAYVQNDPVNWIDFWGLDRWPKSGAGHNVGRLGTLVPPGGKVGTFIENRIGSGWEFGKNHDRTVEKLTKLGFNDFFVNIPTMIPVYFYSITSDLCEMPIEERPNLFPALEMRW